MRDSKLFTALAASALVAISVALADVDVMKQSRIVRSKSGSTSATMDSLSNTESVLVDPLHAFGASLFKAVSDPKKNLIVSPASIHSLLGMLLLGASPDSQTEKELKDILHFPKNQTVEGHKSYKQLMEIFKHVTDLSKQAKQEQHSIFNPERSRPIIDMWSMAIKKGIQAINPSYMDQLRDYYHSSARQVSDKDPEGTKQLAKDINKWGQDSGFGDSFITESELNEQFSMILLSAIRVESSWFESFDEINAEKTFYNHGMKNNLVTNATALANSDVRGRFIEFSQMPNASHKVLTDGLKEKHPKLLEGLLELDFQAIEVPLEGDLSYTIFRPVTSETGNELHILEERLFSLDPITKQTKLAKAFEALDTPEAREKMDFLRMPPFKFENDIELKEPLSSMGLNKIFDPSKAELSKISPVRSYVDKAKHKALIDVNKSGLKAAAFTSMRVMLMSLQIGGHSIRVIVDNPFLFVIRYKRIPLFMGHVVHM